MPAAGWLRAGGVGRPHGLDGSFHVHGPRPALLEAGRDACTSTASRCEIVRRAGTDARPLVRLDGCEDRAAAEALRGRELLAPAVGGARRSSADEWWAEDLEGCAVARRRAGGRASSAGCWRCPRARCSRSSATDGERAARPAGRRRGAHGRRRRRRRIDVDLAFLGEARDGDRRLHAVPGRLRVVRAPAPRGQRPRRRPPPRATFDPRRAHAAQRRPGRRHAVRRRRRDGAPGRRDRGGAAGPLRRRSGRAPRPPPGDRADPGRAPARRSRSSTSSPPSRR